MALQKVGVAKLYEQGDKVTKTRNIMQLLSLFGPFLFVPVVLAGCIIDVVLFHLFGVFSIIGIVIGFVLVFSGLIATLLNLPTEKKSNDIALEIINETGLLTED